eukprot:2750964-Pyramimonas_sp.AAC.1
MWQFWIGFAEHNQYSFPQKVHAGRLRVIPERWRASWQKNLGGPFGNFWSDRETIRIVRVIL